MPKVPREQVSANKPPVQKVPKRVPIETLTHSLTLGRHTLDDERYLVLPSGKTECGSFALIACVCLAVGQHRNRVRPNLNSPYIQDDFKVFRL